jgi:cyclic pyranopterin phosphate synthase
MNLTHLDERGRARMVDVTGKPETVRRAVAHGEVHAAPETVRMIADNRIAKGSVLTVAQLAGIGAAKRTGELIPLCHPIPLTHVDLVLELDPEQGRVLITATAVASGKTGVEMEAMTAVAVAALTVYDMCKAVDRTMTIASVMLVEKHGGKSGSFVRPGWTSASGT